jgi:leucine-rich repeat protein SHOC2
MNSFNANNNLKNNNKILSKVSNPNFITQNNKTNVNLVANSQNSKTIISKVKSAKTTGIINISNMNLDILPKELFDENMRFEDVNWWDMVDVKKLDASNNKLNENSINEETSFDKLPGLNFLKFTNNTFTVIPSSFFTLYNLKYLDLASNRITQISPYICNLKSLVELNLSVNNIPSLPDELGYLFDLEILNLNGNKINILQDKLLTLKKLKRLDLSDNLIERIPNAISNLSMLEELVLFKNKIKQIDDLCFEGLIYLKFLDLHYNQIQFFSSIPKSVKLDSIILGFNKLENISGLQNCENLTVLDLNNNKLEAFPESILSLKNLKTLNLQNNSINDIPPQLCLLSYLVRINIEGNPLKKINSKIRSSNAEQLKTYLKTRLTEDDIKSLEKTGSKKEIFDMDVEVDFNLLNYIHNNVLKLNNMSLADVDYEKLIKLNYNNLLGIDLSQNNIKDILGFNNFPVFKNLIEFRVANNKLTVIPECLFYYPSLKVLDLKSNLLQTFYEGVNINNLNNNIFPSLEYLDISINKFTYIPKIIGSIKRLNTFLAANNNINNIDYLYSTNVNIEILDLGNNKIEAISEKLHLIFPNLRQLNLENNYLKTVPTDLCLLKLNKLVLSGNLIKQIRANILSGGSTVILDYLRKMHKFSEEDLQFQQNEKILPINKQKDMEEINNQILELEWELSNTIDMSMHKKADLRKKLNELIRQRANLSK